MKNPRNQPRYFTVIQVARLIGITRGAVYKKIKNGQIRVKTIEGRVMIPGGFVQELVGKGLTDKTKAEIDKGVAKVMHDFGETLRMLGKE
jgi:predicted transcriptional regulator